MYFIDLGVNMIEHSRSIHTYALLQLFLRN